MGETTQWRTRKWAKRPGFLFLSQVSEKLFSVNKNAGNDTQFHTFLPVRNLKQTQYRIRFERKLESYIFVLMS